jgi:hypothetical protein
MKFNIKFHKHLWRRKRRRRRRRRRIIQAKARKLSPK